MDTKWKYHDLAVTLVPNLIQTQFSICVACIRVSNKASEEQGISIVSLQARTSLICPTHYLQIDLCNLVLSNPISLAICNNKGCYCLRNILNQGPWFFNNHGLHSRVCGSSTSSAELLIDFMHLLHFGGEFGCGSGSRSSKRKIV